MSEYDDYSDLLPIGPLDDDTPRVNTQMAAAEVLSQIPPESLEKLRASEFSWYAPDPWTLGHVTPQAEGGRMIYLSTKLETLNEKIVRAVIAHELAHVALDHTLIPKFNTQELPEDWYKRQEREAWELVERWGFGPEARAHESYTKRRETMGRKLLWARNT